MRSSSTANPESYPKKLTPLFQTPKCKALEQVTPIFMMNFLSKIPSRKVSYDSAVNSISSRFSSGLEYFSNGLKKRIGKISNWSLKKQNEGGNLQSDFEQGSIGSRGYDQFQRDSEAWKEDSTLASSSFSSKCDYSFE